MGRGDNSKYLCAPVAGGSPGFVALFAVANARERQEQRLAVVVPLEGGRLHLPGRDDSGCAESGSGQAGPARVILATASP